MAARVALALLAFLVLGWAGVLLRDVELGKDAAFRAYFGPSARPVQRDRDLRRLDDAQLLDPSSRWDLARASYYLNTGDRLRAASLAGTVVRDEPSDLLAWTVVSRATRQSDRARAAEAAAQIRRLNPLGSR